MSATATMSPVVKFDAYQVVTNRIVEALETGVQPWRKPWSDATQPSVTNGRPLRENGEPYRGINTIALWLAAMERGLGSRYWFTWNRIGELGASVRKGAKSELAFFVGSKLVRDGEPLAEGETLEIGQDGVRRVNFLRTYRVFNGAEIDNLPSRYIDAAVPVLTPFTHANPAAAAFIKHTGADIRYGGNKAFYMPATDSISLPAYASFDCPSAFYATAFHELCHWTKAPDRLNRDTGRKAWGDEGYAMEELVAELGAAFLCADHNLANLTEDQAASYIHGWLKVLKSDKKAIFTAAAMAEKAAGYLHARQPSDPAPEPVAAKPAKPVRRARKGASTPAAALVIPAAPVAPAAPATVAKPAKVRRARKGASTPAAAPAAPLAAWMHAIRATPTPVAPVIPAAPVAPVGAAKPAKPVRRARKGASTWTRPPAIPAPTEPSRFAVAAEQPSDRKDAAKYKYATAELAEQAARRLVTGRGGSTAIWRAPANAVRKGDLHGQVSEVAVVLRDNLDRVWTQVGARPGDYAFL